jgi:F-type H+-transporting ATPase subunit b
MGSAPLTGLLLLSAEGGGGGLTDVDFSLTVATLVLFLIFAFVLGKFAWNPLLQIVAEREKTVREQVEGAEKAQTEAQALLHKRQDMLRDATREREEIIARAAGEAEQVKAEVLGNARTEAGQILGKARAQIEHEKTKAILELRAQVADLALTAAEKIVRSSLTPEVQRQLVDETIAALPRVQ